MNNEMLTSRFFKIDDKRMNEVIFPLPSHWWSRFYEYAWAAEFCKPTDIVLDAACGIPHPFKFYLSHHSKAVHAVDKDEKIIKFAEMVAEMQKVYGEGIKRDFPENLENLINYKQSDITALPYKNNMFDKIFFISVIEHMPDSEKVATLKEFQRILKNSGQIILTVDYPDTTINEIETLANGVGLKLASEKDITIPGNAINWNHNLYCFRMVLVKDKAVNKIGDN